MLLDEQKTKREETAKVEEKQGKDSEHSNDVLVV